MTNRRDAVYHFRGTYYYFAFPAVAAIWRTCKDGLSRKGTRELKAESLCCTKPEQNATGYCSTPFWNRMPDAYEDNNNAQILL